MAKWPDDQIRDMSDGEKYRLLKAKELLLRFKEAHGRAPSDVQEVEAWVKAGGGGSDKPIRPREGLSLDKDE